MDSGRRAVRTNGWTDRALATGRTLGEGTTANATITNAAFFRDIMLLLEAAMASGKPQPLLLPSRYSPAT